MSNQDLTPPREERFVDPAAAVVWAAIQTLDEATKHDMLRELQDHLAAAELRQTPQQSRIARAITALREAADLLAREDTEADLSRDTFARLRTENTSAGWPPDGTIRRWLGGTWNDCLTRAHLPTVADGDVTPFELGGQLEGDLPPLQLLRAARPQRHGEALPERRPHGPHPARCRVPHAAPSTIPIRGWRQAGRHLVDPIEQVVQALIDAAVTPGCHDPGEGMKARHRTVAATGGP